MDIIILNFVIKHSSLLLKFYTLFGLYNFRELLLSQSKYWSFLKRFHKYLESEKSDRMSWGMQ